MSQVSYAKSILDKFGMSNCNASKLPAVKNIHDEIHVVTVLIGTF